MPANTSRKCINMTVGAFKFEEEDDLYILEERQKCAPPSLDPIRMAADVGYPECEVCGQYYQLGGGQMMSIRNYQCVCGWKWGTDYPLNPQALEKGGVFYNTKEINENT